jgi:outer membrane protein OmpA-like peptidoglycan-associated protein
MRLLVVVTAVSLAAPAWAQVTTDPHALDSLPPPAAAPAAPAKTEAPAKTQEKRTASRRRASHTHEAVAPARTLPALKVPPAPPVNPVILPPPFVMPAHPPPPPPPVPVRNDAVGAAAPIKDGVRITFGPGSSDLNPATLAALKGVAAAALADPGMIVEVTAWAPGTADDPSTPRRLSLDRALAARAVLIQAGVVSERIRAVAKGMIDIGSGMPDRMDVTEISPPPADAKAAPTQH